MTDISSTSPTIQEKDIEYYASLLLDMKKDASLLLDMKNDSYYESDELDEIIMNYNTRRQSNQIKIPDIGMKVLFSIGELQKHFRRKVRLKKSEFSNHFGTIVNKGHGFYYIMANNGEIFNLRRDLFIVI
jgi:hypothetical protein